MKKTVFCILISILLAASLSWGSEAPDRQTDEWNGNYSGSYTGTEPSDDSGVWVTIIDNPADGGEGNFFMSMSTDDDSADLGELDFWEDSSPEGAFDSMTEIYDTSIDVTINSATGIVNGQWSNNGAAEEGDITGEATSIDFAGTYSGTFTCTADGCDTSGDWRMVIASDGSITGTATPDSPDVDPVTFVGGAHPDGYVLAVGVDDSGEEPVAVVIFYGEVDGSDASGLWDDGETESGTFTGSLVVGSSSSDSTCFIESLVDK